MLQDHPDSGGKVLTTFRTDGFNNWKQAMNKKAASSESDILMSPSMEDLVSKFAATADR